jgi:hypothetical protein
VARVTMFLASKQPIARCCTFHVPFKAAGKALRGFKDCRENAGSHRTFTGSQAAPCVMLLIGMPFCPLNDLRNAADRHALPPAGRPWTACCTWQRFYFWLCRCANRSTVQLQALNPSQRIPSTPRLFVGQPCSTQCVPTDRQLLSPAGRSRPPAFFGGQAAGVAAWRGGSGLRCRRARCARQVRCT